MSIGKIVGVVMFAGATAAIWLWPKAEAPEAPDETVRPVRSFVVKSGTSLPEMRFAGKVKADESRTLRFKQSGRLERIPVAKGQRVKKGEKLAWLFSEDFENRLQESTAAAERDRLSFQRLSDAAKKNAVSKEEVSKAEAQLKQSEARLTLDKRALDETVLLAPFDGTIADVPATELDMVSAADPIVVLQDMSRIKIDAAVPETVAILQRKLKPVDPKEEGCSVSVVFDSWPAKSYRARFLEYTAAANEGTQTYTATYVMDPIADLLLLPGMSATIVVPAGSYSFGAEDESSSIDIPESAVGVDGQGGYFAWKLVPEGDVFVARKVSLGNCHLKGDKMTVMSGVKPGDRLATAGIAILTEGRKVTLLND